MKVRTGFVSNSSGSSFIVVFDRDISTMNYNDACDYVQEALFGSQKVKKHPYNDIWYGTRELTDIAMLKIRAETRSTVSELALVEARYYEHTPYFEGETEETSHNCREVVGIGRNKREPICRHHVHEWVLKNWGRCCYIFDWSDDGFMEHGNIFKRVQHMQFSHH